MSSGTGPVPPGRHADLQGTTPEELAAVAGASGGPAFSRPVGVNIEVLYADAPASATAGIWRYRAGGWSAVLKLLRHGDAGSPAWRSGEDIDHWYYWRREAEAFRSGLLDALVPPLRAPACYGVFDRPDGACAVWIEDLSAMTRASDWDLGRYRSAATHLGRAQGRLAQAEPPDRPWLARDWLRNYVDRREPAYEAAGDARTWDHPLVRDLLPPDVGERCREIWEHRSELFERADALPRTLTHSDLHPMNLFGSADETVLIDWGFVGTGALGEDVGNLVFDAVLDFFVSPRDLPTLRSALLEGYAEGLATVGLPVPIEALRQAVAAVGAVKYFWIPVAMAEAAAAGKNLLNRRRFEDAFRWWAPVVPEIFAAARAALL